MIFKRFRKWAELIFQFNLIFYAQTPKTRSKKLMEGALNQDQSKKVLENIKNLQSDDKYLKLASLRQLTLIVQVLGPERTLSELFPYM